MLENYGRDHNGVIYQIDARPFIYDETYVARAYGAAPVEAMSHLRLGYVIGAIGHVPDSVLDVGYGNGSFLRTAGRVIGNVFGYDIEPAFPIEGVEIVDSLFNRKYGLITFFDSLEHFRDIRFVCDLNTDYVAISLPWCHYCSDEWFRNWKHRKPDEHLWHFNAEALIMSMEEMGFENVNYCNVEDAIRKSESHLPNILSAVFRKR